MLLLWYMLISISCWMCCFHCSICVNFYSTSYWFEASAIFSLLFCLYILSFFINDLKSCSHCFICTILVKTAINWWWSREGQRISCRYNCTLSRKVENIGPCCKCRWSSFECCRKEAHAGLQWETCSFTSSACVLLGMFVSGNLYWLTPSTFIHFRKWLYILDQNVQFLWYMISYVSDGTCCHQLDDSLHFFLTSPMICWCQIVNLL